MIKKKKNLFDVYVGVNKADPDRKKNDLYPTPPIATYVLHKYGNLPKNIVEPCAGRGNISIELERLGYNVRSYDLNKYEDSLVNVETGYDINFHVRPEGFDALVTNPPYFEDLPRKIAEKGIVQYDYTALFVRLTFLEGKKRYELFKDNPPSDLIFFSDRIKFDDSVIEAVSKKEQLGGMIAYVWVVWNKKASHSTKCRWVVTEDLYDEWFDNYNKWKIDNET